MKRLVTCLRTITQQSLLFGGTHTLHGRTAGSLYFNRNLGGEADIYAFSHPLYRKRKINNFGNLLSGVPFRPTPLVACVQRPPLSLTLLRGRGRLYIGYASRHNVHIGL